MCGVSISTQTHTNDKETDRLESVEHFLYLDWQLQRDGTYLRIAKCPVCGKLYMKEGTVESI